jgi:hypothetical protein
VACAARGFVTEQFRDGGAQRTGIVHHAQRRVFNEQARDIRCIALRLA